MAKKEKHEHRWQFVRIEEPPLSNVKWAFFICYCGAMKKEQVKEV